VRGVWGFNKKRKKKRKRKKLEKGEKEEREEGEDGGIYGQTPTPKISTRLRLDWSIQTVSRIRGPLGQEEAVILGFDWSIFPIVQTETMDNGKEQRNNRPMG
jgi:hypothetical protein